LYPAGATTNSASGVNELEKLYPTLAAMQEVDLPLLIHGEVTDREIDIFDREKVFIDRHLRPITQRFPALRVVLEHITTADAVQFVAGSANNVAATITVHHLLFNRNDMLVGGIRPHYYCLPILKRNSHQQALQAAAISGNPKFFLGTDSAPHSTASKESSCGCAGVYSAHAALELYAEVFEQLQALDKLEAFAAHFGPDFYRLPRNSDTVTLRKQSWNVPANLPLGKDSLTPLRASQAVAWQVLEDGANT
jgi:dihydroorotase